ncbi:MAG: molybdopterin cofactor-binding domain-containing protein [Planctomycetota bacterium]
MKEESFLALDFHDLEVSFPVTRRDFLRFAGGGIFVFVSFGELPFGQGQRGVGQELPADFNAFLRIGADGRVACFTGKIEMGQGIVTSLAQMLAEELALPLDSVDMVMGDTDLCPWDMGTFGSMSTRFFGPPLRQAAAEARAVLIELAAAALARAPQELVAAAGAVHVAGAPEERVTYAALAAGQRIARRVDGRVPLAAPSSFTVIGAPALRADAAAKVTGQALYAADIRLPGMLYARLLRPPAHGAELEAVDTAAAKAISGVTVVEEGELVAALAPDPETAERALERIVARWSTPAPGLTDATIFAHLAENAPPGEVADEAGDLAAGAALAALTVERRYENAYVAHAALEPHAALARVEDGAVTIWASTQAPFRLRAEAAEVLGLAEERVRVVAPFVGGGFGGKTHNSQAIEAVRLARVAGRPVQVAWTREEEFFLDTFRPAALVDIRAGVTAEGRISFWDYSVLGAGERGSRQFYAIPHHRTLIRGEGWRGASRLHPFATGAWRAPANNTNTFGRESHIDELAAAARIDPLEFRRRNLEDARMRRVLDAAATAFGAPFAPAPSGRGFGIACGIDAGTYVTLMAAVDVERETGEVRVRRVVCAQDMGLVINPAGARMQVEGCITMGLGYALSEEVRFASGRILDRNFDTYRLPRISEVPALETVLIEAGDQPPQGGGEPAIVGMGAVIANAVFDATGARLLRLPMTPERVRAAMT